MQSSRVFHSMLLHKGASAKAFILMFVKYTLFVIAVFLDGFELVSEVSEIMHTLVGGYVPATKQYHCT